MERRAKGKRIKVSVGEFIDLINKTFGRLTVLERAYTKEKLIYWKCKCDCGQEVYVSGKYLRNGTTQSCGCFRDEIVKYDNPNTKHSYRYHPLYKKLMDMKARCYNPNNKRYDLYGGKNIKICEEWQSPKNFIEWGINNGWKEGLTIDRIDSNKDYCPENCQWLTSSEHSKKTNKTRWHPNS